MLAYTIFRSLSKVQVYLMKIVLYNNESIKLWKNVQGANEYAFFEVIEVNSTENRVLSIYLNQLFSNVLV